MSVLTIIVVLIVAGVLMYLINRYIPMDSTIKRADELLYVAKRSGRDRVAKDAIERFAA